MAPIPSSEYCVRSGAELKTGGFWRDVFAECLATFLLVLAQIILLQTPPAGPPNSVQVAVGMAFVAASVGYGLGDYGGAHMNPAVTFALMIRAEIGFLRGIFYWIAQVGGGIMAAYFVFAATPGSDVNNLGATRLGPEVEWWQGLLIEAVLTMILCLTALGAQNVPRKGYIILPSLPVGFALGLGLFLGLPTTGGSLNPARSMGPDVVLTINQPENFDAIWEYQWIYWAGPMGGALLAAIFYWIFDSVDKPEMQVYANTNTWAYSGGRTPSKEALTPPGDGGLYPRNMLNGL